MKNCLAIIISILAVNAFSQTNLCRENTMMYSECYLLDSNQTFKYDYHDCTGGRIGMGEYIKSGNTLILNFDSISSPKILKAKAFKPNDRIRISFHYLGDESEIPYVKIEYEQESSLTGLNGKIELDYHGGPIVAYQSSGVDSVILNPDLDSSRTYDVYWHTPDTRFVKAGTMVKMEKKGTKYRMRENRSFFDEKKGKQVIKKRFVYFVEIN